VWVADVHSDDIIPRGYDLSTPQETQAFIDDFRFQKAECWLKSVYKKMSGLDAPAQDELIVKEGGVLFFFMECSAVLCFVVLYYTILCGAVLYCTSSQFCTALYCAVLCCAALYRTILHCTAQCPPLPSSSPLSSLCLLTSPPLSPSPFLPLSFPPSLLSSLSSFFLQEIQRAVMSTQ
jgi:hypothetical protein